MTLQASEVELPDFEEEEVNPREYLKKNLDTLWAHPFYREILDAILGNGFKTIAIWGLPGCGKSHLQRRITKRILGSYKRAYQFRIKEKQDFWRVIEEAKLNKDYWINHKGIWLKRPWIADVDDWGAIFSSMEAQTKEVRDEHPWLQKIRSDIPVMIGSSPLQEDVRRRLRVMADSEIVVWKVITSAGAKHYSSYFSYKYYTDFKRVDKRYLTKDWVCNLKWVPLPIQLLQWEAMSHQQITQTLRKKAMHDLDAKAQVLADDSNYGLSEGMKELMLIVDEAIGKKISSTTNAISPLYKQRFDVNRDPNHIARQLEVLVRNGVIRKDGATVIFSDLGKKVLSRIKPQLEVKSETHNLNETYEGKTEEGV